MEDVIFEKNKSDIDLEKQEQPKQENIASSAIVDEEPIKDIEASAIQHTINIQEIELERRPQKILINKQIPKHQTFQTLPDQHLDFEQEDEKSDKIEITSEYDDIEDYTIAVQKRSIQQQSLDLISYSMEEPSYQSDQNINKKRKVNRSIWQRRNRQPKDDSYS